MPTTDTILKICLDNCTAFNAITFSTLSKESIKLKDS